MAKGKGNKTADFGAGSTKMGGPGKKPSKPFAGKGNPFAGKSKKPAAGGENPAMAAPAFKCGGKVGKRGKC